MDIAVLLPVSSPRASEGLVKHLNCVLQEWDNSGAPVKVTLYLPEDLNILTGRYRAKITHFPSNDYWFGFRNLSKLVAKGDHDVALVLIARYVNLGTLPVVIMVQNVEPIQRVDYPVNLKWKLRLWGLRHENRRACLMANKVIVTTDYVKHCLTDNLGVAAESIEVIPFGIYPEEVVARRTIPVEAADLAAGSFLFTAGSLVPYRGLEDLVRALARLKRQGKSPPLVVVAGEDRTAYGTGIKKLAEKEEISGQFRWLGRLPREEMAWCYQNSRAFVLTTRAESFCNIALEAMAHGCVCVICDHDPMPEVCGDVPLYYRWGNHKALAHCLVELLSAPSSELAQLRERGRGHSARFSWPDVAKRTLGVLEDAIYIKRNRR